MSRALKTLFSKPKKPPQMSLSPQSAHKSGRLINNYGSTHTSATNSPQKNFRNYHTLNYDDKIIYIGQHLKSFKDFTISPTTKKINVQHNLLTNFEGFPSLQNLEELDCSFNNIQNLYQFPTLPKLKKINMSNNPFSNKENYRLSLILVCPSLCIIDDDIIKPFEKSLVAQLSPELANLIRSGWIFTNPPPKGKEIHKIMEKLLKSNKTKNQKAVRSPIQKSLQMKKQSEINNKHLVDQNKEIEKLQNEIKSLQQEINFEEKTKSFEENHQEEEQQQNEEIIKEEEEEKQNEEIIKEEEQQQNEEIIKEEEEEEKQNEEIIKEEEEEKQNEEIIKEEEEEKQNEEITQEQNEEEEEEENDETQHNNDSSQQTVICSSCQNSVDVNDCVYYSGYPYHNDCIKCIVCEKTYKPGEDLNYFVNITKGLFLCQKHYQEHLNGKDVMSPENHQKFHEQKMKNFVEELFNPPTYTDEDICDNPPEDIFITNEIVKETIPMNKPFEYFFPTVTFHFDKQPENFDYESFSKMLNEISEDESIIVNVEHGSVMVQIAILALSEFNLKSKLQKCISNLKEKINTSLGTSIVGNLVEEPEIKFPNNDLIKAAYNKPSMNLLQSSDDLSDTEIENIKKQVINCIHNSKIKTNWSFIFSHEKLYKQAEEQVRKDIQNNPFEMVIIRQTIIANKYLKKYEKIKNEIPDENRKELFLYHGSRLKNHKKIIKKHFLMPGQDKLKNKTDDGYYGKGIYATENLFYASLYGNGYRLLGYHKQSYIICCQAIYNDTKVKELNDLSYKGKKIDKDIKKKYGINHCLVGSLKKFKPISSSEKENNFIYGEEFVFPNKYQLIPICTFTVMRKDHYILWKDENIDNSENSIYLKDISSKLEVNIYGKKTVDEALDVIRTKKQSKVKLVTSAGSDLSGKKLIEESRKITNSNFVCLVFSSSPDHIQWVSEMENVLFTTNVDDFIKFAQIKMSRKNILNFADELSNKYKYQFKINKSELLNFPSIQISEKYIKKLME